MVVHLNLIQPLRRLGAGLLIGSCSATWALGPTAPFTPPRAGGAQDAAAPSDLTAQPAGLAGLRLRNHPMALIDGQWLRIGATVRGARLERIGPGGAVLRHPDGRNELLLWNRIASEGAPSSARPDTITLRTAP